MAYLVSDVEHGKDYTCADIAAVLLQIQTLLNQGVMGITITAV